jgi:hypothetical protein
VEDGWLLLRTSPEAAPQTHMALTAPQCYAVERFDGRHSVADISAATAAAFSLPPDEAGKIVAALFVSLAQNGLCHPLERPE